MGAEVVMGWTEHGIRIMSVLAGKVGDGAASACNYVSYDIARQTI